MGLIKTLADLAWRDFNIDGSPASGFNKPKKTEIRSALARVDFEVSALDDRLKTISGVVDVAAHDAKDDNGTTNNAAAFLAAKTEAAGGVVRVRKNASGVYYFGDGGLDLSGVTWDIEPGVVLKGFVSWDQGISTLRPFRVDYDADIRFTYWVGVRPDARAKPPVQAVTPEFSRRQVVQASQISLEKLSNYASSDAFVADSTAAKSAGNVQWADATNSAERRCAFVPLIGRNFWREIVFDWDNVTWDNCHIGVCIRCAKGWVDISCLGDANTMTLTVHPYGGSSSTSTVPQWWGRSNLDNFNPRMGVWTLRPLSKFEFVLSLEGVAVARVNTYAVGEILEGGPAIRGNAAGTYTIKAGRITMDEREFSQIGNRIGLLVVGDSKSDETNEAGSAAHYPVVWPQYAAAFIEGSLGNRISHYKNLAVGGAQTLDQLTRLQSFFATSEADNYTDLLVELGTNDIQANNNYTDVYSRFATLIDAAHARNMRVTVIVPDALYPRAVAASITGVSNQGQNVVTYQIGAPIRNAIRQCAMDKSVNGRRVGIVDGLRVVGLEIPEWLAGYYYTQPNLADNSHGDALIYPAKMGYAVAREHLALLNAGGPADFSMAVPVSWLGAGFASSDLTLTCGGGQITISGQIIKSSGTWNSAILTIPRAFWPKYQARDMVDDGGGTAVIVYVSTGGVVSTSSGSSATSVPLNLSWMNQFL